MDSFVDNLLRKQKAKAGRSKKAMNFFVDPDVGEAFKRACHTGGLSMSQCFEAFMHDFIIKRAYSPDQLATFKFVGTANQAKEHEDAKEIAKRRAARERLQRERAGVIDRVTSSEDPREDEEKDTYHMTQS